MNAEQRQTAADLWTKPTDLSHWPACKQLGNYIHHRHLLLLSPKVVTLFTIPQRVGGWVDGRPRCLVIYPDGLPACEQSPAQVVTGPSIDNYKSLQSSKRRMEETNTPPGLAEFGTRPIPMFRCVCDSVRLYNTVTFQVSRGRYV